MEMQRFFGKYRRVLEQLGWFGLFSLVVILTIRVTIPFASVTNSITIAFIFSTIVLFAAFFGNFYSAILISLETALCFNYFYLPPVGTFTISSFSDGIAFLAFTITVICISILTNSASKRKAALTRALVQLDQLEEIQRWMQLSMDKAVTLTGIAEKVLATFAFEYCSIHILTPGNWQNWVGQAYRGQPAFRQAFPIGEDHQIGVEELASEGEIAVRYIRVQTENGLHILCAYKCAESDNGVLPSLSNAVALFIGWKFPNNGQ